MLCEFFAVVLVFVLSSFILISNLGKYEVKLHNTLYSVDV
jgi:hypothetical protein